MGASPPLAPRPLAKLRRIREILRSLFVGRGEEVDAVLVTLLSAENLLLVAPPGTAKTTLVRALGRLIDADVFVRTATEFDQREDYFGYIDVETLVRERRIRYVGRSIRTADIVFVDEIFRSSAAVRNLLLEVLASRTVDGEPVRCIAFYSASNYVSREEEDSAFADRFLKNFHGYVPVELLPRLVEVGVELRYIDVSRELLGDGDSRDPLGPVMDVGEVRGLVRYVHSYARSIARNRAFIRLLQRVREILDAAGIRLSDRSVVRIPIVVSAYSAVTGFKMPEILLIKAIPMFARDEKEAAEVSRIVKEELDSLAPITDLRGMIASLESFVELANDLLAGIARGTAEPGLARQLARAGLELMRHVRSVFERADDAVKFCFREDFSRAMSMAEKAVRGLEEAYRRSAMFRR